jgi:hypothetical protein
MVHSKSVGMAKERWTSRATPAGDVHLCSGSKYGDKQNGGHRKLQPFVPGVLAAVLHEVDAQAQERNDDEHGDKNHVQHE